MPPAARPPGTALAVKVAGALLAVVVIAAVGMAATGGRSTAHDGDRATGLPTPLMVAPDGVLDLASVSADVAEEYRYAAEHPAAYRQLRCWCGCEAAFEHASLLDCFLRPDGQWEAHGAGCGVCIAESITARTSLERGIAVTDIAAALDAQFGPASIRDPQRADPQRPDPTRKDQ